MSSALATNVTGHYFVRVKFEPNAELFGGSDPPWRYQGYFDPGMKAFGGRGTTGTYPPLARPTSATVSWATGSPFQSPYLIHSGSIVSRTDSC